MTSMRRITVPKIGGGVRKTAVGLFAGFLLWPPLAHASTAPTASHASPTSAAIDIGILVFREGLECILVLAAITASLARERGRYQRPIAVGAVAGFVATLLTWFVAVRIADDLSAERSALALQAGTGLLAVLVLLVVMNWFFHRVFWTGWISAHNRRKQELLQGAGHPGSSRRRLFGGDGAIGLHVILPRRL